MLFVIKTIASQKTLLHTNNKRKTETDSFWSQFDVNGKSMHFDEDNARKTIFS